MTKTNSRLQELRAAAWRARNGKTVEDCRVAPRERADDGPTVRVRTMRNSSRNHLRHNNMGRSLQTIDKPRLKTSFEHILPLAEDEPNE